MGIIYLITCIPTGKKYVGLTTSTLMRRWREHKANAKSRRTRIANAIRKYGNDAFLIELLEDVSDSTMLEEREKYWIDRLDTFRNGYNLTSGGELGKKWSDESKGKVSLANTGRVRSEEFKKRAAEISSGRQHSVETKKKMSSWQKGKAKPDGFGEKISKIMGKKISVYGVAYNSMLDASKSLGIDPETVSRRLKRGVDGYKYRTGDTNG